MRSITFSDSPPYAVVFLVASLREDEIRKEYLDPFGVPYVDVRCLPLHLSGKSTAVREMKRYFSEELEPELEGARYLVVADSGYFKVLTGHGAEASLGYVRPSTCGRWLVVYVPSARTIWYDPGKVRGKIARGMGALMAHALGTYSEPGSGIVHFEAYPETDEEVAAWLERLLEMRCPLACDTEAFGLKHYSAGLGTISFCWSKHEGVAFAVDYVSREWTDSEGVLHHGVQVRNERRRELLRNFFRRMMERVDYHNVTFDAYLLIYQLFMSDLLDTAGLLDGMAVMLRNWDCTQVITYLATNTCAGNELGLKANAHEHAGKYMIDVKDITLQRLPDLLRYNLIDGLATVYLREKNYPRMVADQQLGVYEAIFKPSVLDIVQAQLTGLPVDMAQVRWVKRVLQATEADALGRMQGTATVAGFNRRLREQHVARRNEKLKKKRLSPDDPEVLGVCFNPRSAPQLQDLLYGELGLPVISYTETGQPGTDGDTLESLMNHAGSPDVREFLQSLVDYKAVSKILSDFIPSFEGAVLGLDGWHYLFGSFKLGGTRSGRLSSQDPNLQNLPSNVQMAISAAILAIFPGLARFVKKGKLHLGKLIKSCVVAPPGWVFVGLDFMSLEDRISALTTKDPNKLKVYTDGYDGHSMRTFAYFPDQLPDIVDTVESINSIQAKYPTLRYDSKAPTFALTYQGTYKTLMTNCGFSEEKARSVEARYHELYQVSDRWVQERLDRAGRDGYVTAAFGLRIRTPLLAQTIRGTKKTPREAEAEGRTAGNALGQSWCMLTNRAESAFMALVRAGEHRLDIKPSAFIHDALYHLVRDEAAPILYANRHLRREVKWQDHPDIAHDQVHLDGAMSVFCPDWAEEVELPEEADEEDLAEVIRSLAA